ncbi:MAG: hypothetical protein ACE5DO_00120 [Desulfobacterales bacterium]
MSTGLARMLWVAVRLLGLIILTQSPVLTAKAVEEKLAEGKFQYISSSQDGAFFTARWSEFARLMPNWKEKSKRAHYRFNKGVIGRKCSQMACHPGFTDIYVNRLTALPEGKKRIQAQQERFGLKRCDDCHSYQVIREKTFACRIHYQLRDRVRCDSCHAEGSKVMVSQGEKKTIVLSDYDDHQEWPAHMLTKNKNQNSCNKNCHVTGNPFSVESICLKCHDKGKLELETYFTPNLLVHSRARDSAIPDILRTLFKILVLGVAAFCFFYIVTDLIRSQKKTRL